MFRFPPGMSLTRPGARQSSRSTGLVFDTLAPATDTSTVISGPDTTRLTFSPFCGGCDSRQRPFAGVDHRTYHGLRHATPVRLPSALDMYGWTAPTAPGARCHSRNPQDSLRTSRWCSAICHSGQPIRHARCSRPAVVLNWRAEHAAAGGRRREDDGDRMAIVDSMHKAAFPVIEAASRAGTCHGPQVPGSTGTSGCEQYDPPVKEELCGDRSGDWRSAVRTMTMMVMMTMASADSVDNQAASAPAT